MTDTAKQLTSVLAELSQEDRAALAEFLLNSLECDTQDGTDEDLNSVLRRRADEIRSGKVKGIPRDEVIREIRRELEKRREAV